MSYFLDVSEDWLTTVGDQWEKQFLYDVKKYEDMLYPDLKVGMFVSNTPAWEMEQVKLNFWALTSVAVEYSAVPNNCIVWNNRGGYYLGLFGHYIKNHVLFNKFLWK